MFLESAFVFKLLLIGVNVSFHGQVQKKKLCLGFCTKMCSAILIVFVWDDIATWHAESWKRTCNTCRIGWNRVWHFWVLFHGTEYCLISYSLNAGKLFILGDFLKAICQGIK